MAAGLALLTLGAAEADGQSLRGSRRSVNLMHQHALRADLPFFRTPSGVRRAASQGRVARIRSNAHYRLHSSVRYPYLDPTAKLFLERLARQYRAACGEPLVVTSALRPTSRQPRNASPKSVHPAGIAIDLRKPKGSCRTWLRTALLAMERRGVIEATEEFYPPHFHVAVLPGPYRRDLKRRGITVAAR